jgi:hypothetical protein
MGGGPLSATSALGTGPDTCEGPVPDAHDVEDLVRVLRLGPLQGGDLVDVEFIDEYSKALYITGSKEYFPTYAKNNNSVKGS